eukprot:gene30444-36792_t
MSFKEILEAGIGLQLDLLLCSALLNKQFRELTLHQFVVHKADVANAHLLEPSASRLNFLLDTGRMYTYSSGLAVLPKEVVEIIKIAGLQALRRTPQSMMYLRSLNVKMYTHWYGTPSDPEHGIYAHLDEGFERRKEMKTYPEAKLLRQNFEQDCRFWGTSRVTGNLIVLFDRPDGSVLVSGDFQHVYLVLGLAQSMGEVTYLGYRDWSFYRKPPFPFPCMHSPVVGVVIKTTLLNWEGKIVNDGQLVPVHMASQSMLQKALRAYEMAYNTNAIISQLPLVEPSPGLGEPLGEPEL